MNVKANRIIVTPDAPTKQPIVVKDGVVGLFIATLKGRRIVSTRYAGETVQPHETHGLGVIALLESNIFREAEAPDSRDYARIAYEWLARQRLASEAQLAHFICEHAIRGGYKDVAIEMFTQQHVADILGQTSVNVNRVLASLCKEGLIRRKTARLLTILDYEGLTGMGEFRPAYLDAHKVSEPVAT